MIRVDSRERNLDLRGIADEVCLLEHRGPNGEVWSYDVEVTTQTGQVLRGERKSAATDLASSFASGGFERQCSIVDFLIVEVSLDDVLGARSPALLDNALDHLDILSFHLPVLRSDGPADTARRLRRLEGREGGITIRQNKLATTSPDTRWRILEALPQVNPYRPLHGGRTLGQELEGIVDWAAIARALHLDEWREKVAWGDSRPIPRATIGRIRKDLAGGE
jgi:hypothetical protein